MTGRHARRPRAKVAAATIPVAVFAVVVVAAGPAAAAPGCMPPPEGPGAPSSPGAILGSVSGNHDHAGPVGGTPATSVSTAASAPGLTDPVGAAAAAFGDYARTEHIDRGLGAQVQDVAQADTWARAHQVLLRRMLDPEVGPGSTAATGPYTGPVMSQLDAHYWSTSPAEQVKRVADFDSWNLEQIELARRVADPVVGEHSALGMTPGTAVLLRHLDDGHWNVSVNGQIRAITDDFPNWYAMHAAMLQATTQSLQSGSTHDDHHGPGHIH